MVSIKESEREKTILTSVLQTQQYIFWRQWHSSMLGSTRDYIQNTGLAITNDTCVQQDLKLRETTGNMMGEAKCNSAKPLES